MTRDDALRRVRACLRLSKSSNAHEAAAALRQAQKLMEEFNLEAEVDGAVGASDAGTRSRGGAVPEYVAILVNLVSFTFGVRAFERKGRGRTTVCFVGVEPAPEMASYVFTVLRRQLEAALTRHTSRFRVNLDKRRKLFAHGWLLAVRSKVDLKTPLEMAAVDTRIRTFVSREFNVVVEADGDDASVRKGQNIRLPKRVTSDVVAGYVAGTSAQLHHGVGRSGGSTPTAAVGRLELQ